MEEEDNSALIEELKEVALGNGGADEVAPEAHDNGGAADEAEKKRLTRNLKNRRRRRTGK